MIGIMSTHNYMYNVQCHKSTETFLVPYPPHLRPSAVRADLSRSSPSDISSSGEENAVRSSCAPECLAMALPVSFYMYMMQRDTQIICAQTH